MGMFDHFPYTNFHELNLDWILQALKEIEKTMDQFVAINSLKYADPIQWNIVRQYEKNTIVIDPLTGTAYISVQPVPSGVAITNTDYWTVVFDLGSFVVRAAKNFTNRWESETTNTATFSSNVNDWLIWGDTLYKAKVNITAGDSYVIGSNIEHFTIEDLTGHIEDLTTWDKSSVVNAINSVKHDTDEETAARTEQIGDLEDLTTWDKTSVVNAINSVKHDTDEEAEARTEQIGDLEDLTTSVKTSVVNAINSVKSDTDAETAARTEQIGDLEDLTTWNKTSVVNAINSVKSDADNTRALVDRSSIYDFFHNKKVLIIGDSNSIEGEAWRGRVWVDDFREILNGTGATIDNNSVSGRTITKPAGSTNNMVDVVDSLSAGNYDYIIVFLGINDWNNQYPLGDTNHYDNWNYTLVSDAIRYSTERLKTLFPTAGLFFVTPLICNYANPAIPLVCYHNAIYANANWHDRDIVVIDGFCAPNYWVNGSSPTNYSIDGLHFNAAYAPILARYIISSMMVGGSAKSEMSYMKNLTVNSNIASGLAYLNYKSDGKIDFYMDVTLTTPAYEALITDGGIPDFACNDYGGVFWWGRLTDASDNNTMAIEALDFNNNSPYPKTGYFEAGDRYYIKITFSPVSMNRNVY